MVRSGIVISVNHADGHGIIRENKSKREFYFRIDECVDHQLPEVFDDVTFVKDRDYNSTDVASLIKRSEVFKKLG